MEVCESLAQPSPFNASSRVYPPVTPPPNLQHQYKQYQKRVSSPNPGFRIHYVLCTDLFINNQEELFLCLQPEGDTMEHLINLICHTHNIPESLTVELFSEEGFPLNVNSFTMKSKQALYLYNLILIILLLGSGKCLYYKYHIFLIAETLAQWNIENDDGFMPFYAAKNNLFEKLMK